MKSKLIIDTDCGSDDAMAIAMALRDDGWEVLFFTVVSGNVILEQAVKNTLLSIEMAGTYAPPVYAGCREMLLRPLAFAHETHGRDGMGDLGLAPEWLRPAEGHGVFKLLEALRNHDRGEIEIVTLGPLTNIAVAQRLDPAAMARVRRISIMGSAGLGAGNVSPLAEFNIWQDAEAAKIVFESGLPLFLVGWDACLDDAMLEEADIERLRRSGPLGRFVMDCNRRLLALNLERFGRPCLDMADPAAMAAALFPDCVGVCGEYFCEVDTAAGPAYGAVLVDRWRFSGKKPNLRLCSRLKPEKYREYLFRTLGA
ncbi:MAG: nucleoside hydrolase [Treponema sp.]|nr:nucleoside hydrolase [Treponema sp.]